MLDILIKTLRINAGLTQKKAAELLGIELRSWERYEASDRVPSLQNVELFCIKTNQNFNEFEFIISEYLKLDDVKKELFKKISEKITGDIFSESEDKRMKSEFCKLEHHDGKIKITKWGDKSIYSRTKCDANIQTFNNKLLNKTEIKFKVVEFLCECLSKNLALKY